jgi:L-rhamnose mutarotase
MNRVCFTLRVKRTALEEYKANHQHVWPEMLAALTRSGWHNYSLFLTEDGLLIGYFETAGTFENALAAMSSEPVNAKWQAMMAPFFEGSGGHADEMMGQIAEIFHLP